MNPGIKDAFYKYLKDPELYEGELISKLEKQRQNWYQLRQQDHDTNWRQNSAFYAGNHYVRDTGRNANQYRVKLRENHTNNTIQRMVSIFMQNMPVTRVFPVTTEYEDVNNAETTEAYAKYFWKTKALDLKLAKLVKYSAIFGNGFIYRGYDPYAGGKLVLDANETKSGDKEIKTYRGDVDVKIDDPFRIIVRPGIEEMCDMFDFYRSEPSNKVELEAMYGEISSEPTNSLNMYNGTLRTDDELTMVHHYYHKPTHWFEDGMYVSYVGKKILKAETFPYNDGQLPLLHLPFDKPPMRFYANSTIDQVIDLQEQLNRASSMIVEARNLLARPRVLVSNEANVAGQQISDRPGDILRYKLAGGPPKFEVPNFNFAEMAAHKSDLRNTFQMVSGMTSASRGEIPQATKTALALQLVLEQDRSQWTPFIKTFYRVIEDLMIGSLGIAAQFFPEEDPRTIKIEKNSGVIAKTFHGGMVPSPLDISLEDTNPLGWTSAGRIESIQSLVQLGVLTDKDQILDMLKLTNSDPAFEMTSISKQAAQKENELMLRGQILEVMEEDYDPIHLAEHLKITSAFDFREKPPLVQRLILDHINKHKERMQPPPPPPGPGMAPPPGMGAPPPPMGPQFHGSASGAKGLDDVQKSMMGPDQLVSMQGLLNRHG